MSISGRAKVAGVIGDPVAQSLSPRLHAHWLRAHGIDGAYVPLRVPRESFALALRGLRAAGFIGVNVTVPHKEAAFALAGRLDRAARAAGAVNLLVFHADGLEGRNTDADGLAASLVQGLGRHALSGRPAAILGAGGAARAAVVALSAMGVGEVRILARNRDRAEALVRALAPASNAPLRAMAWQQWPAAAAGTALVINATSAGMSGKPPLDLALETLDRAAAVCDLVYNPLETPFLAAARARGHAVVDGLGMLMHQAVPAFEAFYGVRPSVTPALRGELEEALRHGC